MTCQVTGQRLVSTHVSRQDSWASCRPLLCAARRVLLVPWRYSAQVQAGCPWSRGAYRLPGACGCLGVPLAGETMNNSGAQGLIGWLMVKSGLDVGCLLFWLLGMIRACSNHVFNHCSTIQRASMCLASGVVIMLKTRPWLKLLLTCICPATIV